MAYRDGWADFVRVANAGHTYRWLAAQIETSHALVADMVQGRVPSRAVVIRLGQVTGAGEEEALAAAGYWEPSPKWMAGVAELVDEFGSVVLQPGDVPAGDASPVDVRVVLARLRRRAEEQRNAAVVSAAPVAGRRAAS